MELKIARTVARLTQRELGDAAGVDDSTISTIENGKMAIGRVAYESVVRIARVLAPGVAVEQLFPVADLPRKVDDDVERSA